MHKLRKTVAVLSIIARYFRSTERYHCSCAVSREGQTLGVAAIATKICTTLPATLWSEVNSSIGELQHQCRGMRITTRVIVK